jgi:hypothetical protein
MLKVFLDTLSTGTPIAILVAFVGISLQYAHTAMRERANDRQKDREFELNEQKFQHQQQLEEKKFEYDKRLEEKKFEYEQSRWREQLGREITVRLVEVRLEEYSRVWSNVMGIAKSERAGLTPQSAKEIARQIREWRYSKGGLLAEENARDAAYALQKVLFRYDGSDGDWRHVRDARKIFRNAIRADMGLSEAIYEITQERQKVRRSLDDFRVQVGPEALESDT